MILTRTKTEPDIFGARKLADDTAIEHGHALNWESRGGRLVGCCDSCGATVRVCTEVFPEEVARTVPAVAIRDDGAIWVRDFFNQHARHVAQGKALTQPCPDSGRLLDRHLASRGF